MKKSTQLLFLMFIMMLATAGCRRSGKNNSDPVPAMPAVGTINITVDGMKWDPYVTMAAISTTEGRFNVSLGSGRPDGTSVSFMKTYATSVTGSTPVKPVNNTVLIEGTVLSYIEKATDGSLVQYLSACDNGSGFLKITDQDVNNKTITGSFSGTLCSASGGKRKVSGSFNKFKYD